MSKLTDLCRGQPCYIRLPGICNWDPEKSSPAHIRLIGVSGMSIKAHDFFSCPACSDCHDAVDRRRYKDLDRDYVLLAHHQALTRWQNDLLEREIIAVTI